MLPPFVVTTIVGCHFRECKKYGYVANPMKTWLVTWNPSVARAAMHVLEGTNVNITSDGRPHVGVPLGTQEYADELIARKVEQWFTEHRSLSNIAESQPQAAYAALMHGLSSKWSYLSRTISGISHHLESLESIEVIPRFTGRLPPDDDEHIFLVLPGWVAWVSEIQQSRQIMNSNPQEWSLIH